MDLSLNILNRPAIVLHFLGPHHLVSVQIWGPHGLARSVLLETFISLLYCNCWSWKCLYFHLRNAQFLAAFQPNVGCWEVGLPHVGCCMYWSCIVDQIVCFFDYSIAALAVQIAACMLCVMLCSAAILPFLLLRLPYINLGHLGYLCGLILHLKHAIFKSRLPNFCLKYLHHGTFQFQNLGHLSSFCS